MRRTGWMHRFRIPSSIVYHGFVGQPMLALQLTEYRKLQLVDMPVPSPAADEVLIEVSACGICGSDVHGYDGSTGRRIPPIVMGHEAAGTVVAVGSGVENFKAGDRVTFDSTVYCGRCDYCVKGEVNLCDNRQVIGVSCKEISAGGGVCGVPDGPGADCVSTAGQLFVSTCGDA